MSNTSTNLNPLYLLVQQSHPDQCGSVQQEIMWTSSTTLFKKSMIFFVLHKENNEKAHWTNAWVWSNPIGKTIGRINA